MSVGVRQVLSSCPLLKRGSCRRGDSQGTWGCAEWQLCLRGQLHALAGCGHLHVPGALSPEVFHGGIALKPQG